MRLGNLKKTKVLLAQPCKQLFVCLFVNNRLLFSIVQTWALVDQVALVVSKFVSNSTVDPWAIWGDTKGQWAPRHTDTSSLPLSPKTDPPTVYSSSAPCAPHCPSDAPSYRSYCCKTKTIEFTHLLFICLFVCYWLLFQLTCDACLFVCVLF